MLLYGGAAPALGSLAGGRRMEQGQHVALAQNLCLFPIILWLFSNKFEGKERKKRSALPNGGEFRGNRANNPIEHSQRSP